MTELELLERLDKHMERGNQIMSEASEIHREHREFIREMTVRQQRYFDRIGAQLEANTARVEAGTVELKDLSLATRQHTQALARTLDRLE